MIHLLIIFLFKILLIFLPIFLTFCSFMPYVPPLKEIGSECYSILVYCFTYSSTWVMIVALLVYEFVLYPLIRNMLPSMLKRIGFLLFLVSVFNLVELMIKIFLKQLWGHIHHPCLLHSP